MISRSKTRRTAPWALTTLAAALLSSCAATGHFATGIAPEVRHSDEGDGPPQAAGIRLVLAPEQVVGRPTERPAPTRPMRVEEDEDRAQEVQQDEPAADVGGDVEVEVVLARLLGTEPDRGPVRPATASWGHEQAIEADEVRESQTTDNGSGYQLDGSLVVSLREERRRCEELSGRRRALGDVLDGTADVAHETKVRIGEALRHIDVAEQAWRRAERALAGDDEVLARIELLVATRERETGERALGQCCKALGWR